jgi:multisubunit Na+/H+ antiporter MnhF subunit
MSNIEVKEVRSVQYLEESYCIIRLFIGPTIEDRLLYCYGNSAMPLEVLISSFIYYSEKQGVPAW